VTCINQVKGHVVAAIKSMLHGVPAAINSFCEVEKECFEFIVNAKPIRESICKKDDSCLLRCC